MILWHPQHAGVPLHPSGIILYHRGWRFIPRSLFRNHRSIVNPVRVRSSRETLERVDERLLITETSNEHEVSAKLGIDIVNSLDRGEIHAMIK